MYYTPKEQRQQLSFRLLILVVLITILLTIGTITYHFSEGWSLQDSLYFSTISLTSKGYSNMHPTHWFSVLFSVLYLIIGVALVLYTLSSLIAYYTAYYQRQVEHKMKKLVDKIKENKKKDPENWLMLKIKK